jgi:hypothetical protein
MHQKKERKKEKKAAPLHLTHAETLTQLILSFSEQLVVVLQRILSSKTTKESKSSTML